MAAQLILGMSTFLDRLCPAQCVYVTDAQGPQLDERPGMLDMMVSSTYPGLTQSTIRFDEETKEISRRLTTN